MSDDVVDQVSCRLRHAPGTVRRANAASLATDGDQLVLPSVAAVQAQEILRQDAAFEKGV